MIAKSTVIKTVVNRLGKMEHNHALELKTYKRDRSVLIVKRGEDDYLFIEDGFSKETYEINGGKIKSLLKTLLKKEFPRSNKVRLYNLGEYESTLPSVVRRKI